MVDKIKQKTDELFSQLKLQLTTIAAYTKCYHFSFTNGNYTVGSVFVYDNKIDVNVQYFSGIKHNESFTVISDAVKFLNNLVIANQCNVISAVTNN